MYHVHKHSLAIFVKLMNLKYLETYVNLINLAIPN
jgi:hypothetical protein